MKAYIRVHQIKNPPNNSGLSITINVNPKGPEMSCECSGLPVTCYKVFQLMCDDQYETQGTIQITLKKTRLLRSPKDLAILVLPFSWFEVDKTIRYEYPLKSVDKKAKDVKMDVEVHLASDPKIRAFDAPTGKLLCIPTWEVSSPEKEDIPVSSYQPPSAPAMPAPASPTNFYEQQAQQSNQLNYPQYPSPEQQQNVYNPYQQNENIPHQQNTETSPYQDSSNQSPYDNYPTI